MPVESVLGSANVDRSITVSATKAVEFGYGVLACDSTGNKASSTAAYAARVGAAAVTREGAQESFPTAEEVDAL